MYCNECRFWNVSKQEREFEHSAECYRFPPTVIFHSNTNIIEYIYPRTYKYKWCGEFKNHKE